MKGNITACITKHFLFPAPPLALPVALLNGQRLAGESPGQSIKWPNVRRVQDPEDLVVIRRRFHLPMKRQDYSDASLTTKDSNKTR
jgi:hypothetical protein